MLLKEQKKYAEAEQVFKRSLLIMEKALGLEHADVGTSLNHLAGFYQDQGKYAEAELLYERALAILETALGAESPELADTLNNLVTALNLRAKRGKPNRFISNCWQSRKLIWDRPIRRSLPQLRIWPLFTSTTANSTRQSGFTSECWR